MNVELLQKVKAHILEEPNRFVMTHWQVFESPGVEVHLGNAEGQTYRKMPPCGTMACIAGWTVILGAPDGLFRKTGQYSTSEMAAHLLGLPEFPRELFYLQHWTPHFRKLWKVTRSPRKHAQIAARVIDRFIKENE